MANAPDLSLRGGRRPTWRPERAARGSALGVQSREGSYVFADSFPTMQQGTARFPRRFAPRNDNRGSIFGRRWCIPTCSCQRRSLSAATDAIGFTFLSETGTNREFCAGPGCPLPSLSKKFLWTFWTSCFQNCKIKFCSMILQFCRCGGLFDVKGNPDGFLSHYSSLRNFPLSVFHLRHAPHFSLQFTDSRHSAACLPGRRAGFPR